LLKSVAVLSTAAQLYKKLHLRPVNDPECHQNWHYLTCSDVSVLHCFRDITIFTVYVSAYNIKTSFIFNMAVKIIGHVTFCFVSEQA